ncbi:hypothetical protein ACFQ0M_24160 [Kitasatospora aburaviensis]
MSRQFSREAAPSAPAPDRHGAPAARGRRLRPAAAGASAALAAGLLIGWNPPPSAAQQSPDGWSGEHRAVLPSGLTVQLDFAAAPGTAVIAEPGSWPTVPEAAGRPRSTPTDCGPETPRRLSGSRPSVRRRTAPGARWARFSSPSPGPSGTPGSTSPGSPERPPERAAARAPRPG